MYISSKKSWYILSIGLLSTIVLIFILLRYTNIFGPYFNTFKKISLKDTVLDKFDTDIAFKVYSERFFTPLNEKEDFVFIAKVMYCVSRIPRDVLEKYYFDVFTERFKSKAKKISPEELKKDVNEYVYHVQDALRPVFSTHYTDETFFDSVVYIMISTYLPKNLNVELVRIVQKFIGHLDTSLNTLLEDDLKSKLIEKKSEKNLPMLSCLDKYLIRTIISDVE